MRPVLGTLLQQSNQEPAASTAEGQTAEAVEPAVITADRGAGIRGRGASS